MENQSVVQKLEALVKLQSIDSKIDEIKKLRGDLPDEVREVGMTVVPADELRRPDDARQILAGNAELAVVRGAGGEDDGVIEFQ